MEYIVVDLEMNPVGREFREVRRRLNEEVIEFGAIKLDDNFNKVGTFQCYVAPEYGLIKKHITKLTGITQAMVAGQENYATCFKKFIEWVGNGETKIYSWSMSDIEQLKRECRYKLPEFDVTWLNERWIDLQQAFDDQLGLHNNLALKHALGAIGCTFEGTQHTALDDAINTSAILVLMQDEVKFKTTMQPIIDILQPKEDLASSIGDLCPDLLKLKSQL